MGIMKDGLLSGKGTVKDPFIYEWSSFTNIKDIALFNCCTEQLSEINESRNYPKASHYYRYKTWKRGNSNFHFYPFLNHMMDILVELKKRGFEMSHKTKTALLELNEHKLEESINADVKLANKIYEKNQKLQFKLGDVIEFNYNGKLRSGKLIKIKSKLGVVLATHNIGEILNEYVFLLDSRSGAGLIRHNELKIIK